MTPTITVPGARDLRPLFDPTSVAVVGASNSATKWGYWLTRGAIKGERRRAVHLVNRGGEEVFGRPTVRSLEELPAPAELVAVAVPLAGFDAAIDAALAAGTKAIVAVNAGFAEQGEEGLARQRELVERVRAAGAVLVGPNCLGVVDNTTDLEVAWMQTGAEGVPVGPMAVVSQSGNVALDIMLQGAQVGLGLSRFVSVGNQADLGVADFVQDLAAHDGTELIAIYCEDFRDGRALLRAVETAVAAGKRVVLLAAGGSEASSRAARSHTGSLTSDPLVVAAACRAAGAIQAQSIAELVEVGQTVVRCPPPRGRRVAVVSDGGGHGVVGADAVSAAGLEVTALSAATQQALIDVLDPTAATGNPVDLASSNTDPESMERAVRVLVESGEVDGVMVAGGYGSWSEFDPEAGPQERVSGERMAAHALAAGVPLFIQSVFSHGENCQAMRAAGVPAYRDASAAVRAYAALVQASERPPAGVPALPDDAVEAPGETGYFAARALLQEAGIAFPQAREVADADAAVTAAAEIGWPVALKAVGLLHKSDAGGVALGLRDEASLREALCRMAGLGSPTYSVEAMADLSDAVDLVIGCRRDPRFGPVVLVGLGGIYTEILGDVAVALAPAAPELLERLLGELRGAALLQGARGRPVVDVRAAAEAAARISEVAARHAWIAEIEINPLVVTPGGALALDARVLAEDEEGSA